MAGANRLPHDKSRFLIGVEHARHQGANHPEAGTTLQREADRKRVAIRACIGLIFAVGEYPPRVGVVAAELLPPGFSSISCWRGWR
ncbi:MAG: hypothetical protein DPW09_41900 [Anaerolineae bacterium]|nr:hypothetical protein [Anaerolineae bacterium]